LVVVAAVSWGRWALQLPARFAMMRLMAQIKAILFDLGDTLINYDRVNVSRALKKAAHLTYDYLVGRYGAERLGLFRDYRRRNVRALMLRYFWSQFTNREFDALGLIGRQLQRMGLRVSESELEELARLWYEPVAAHAWTEPGLAEHLACLRGMDLQFAIVSNTFSPPFVLDEQLEAFGLLEYFPIRVYSSVSVVRKPHAGIFRSALEQINVPASQAVMIGDRLREDVRGALRFGMRAVFKRGPLNRHRRVRRGVPVIESIGEIPQLIQEWRCQSG